MKATYLRLPIAALALLLGTSSQIRADSIDSFAVGPQSHALGPGDSYWSDTATGLDPAQVAGGTRLLTLLADADSAFRGLEEGLVSATINGATPGSLSIQAAIPDPAPASSYEPAVILSYDSLVADWSAFDRIVIRFSTPPNANVTVQTSINSAGNPSWADTSVPAGSTSATILFSEFSGLSPTNINETRFQWNLPREVSLVIRDIQVTAAPVANLNADLGMRFDAQYSDEGQCYNIYTLSLTNTGEVPIFALFIAPNQDAGYGSRGTMDPFDADPWDGWSVAMYDNGWYLLNSGDQYITNLSDVPNAAGWAYGQGLGIFWNTSHDAVTHQTTNPLAPGSTLAGFMQYGIAGFEAGQTNPPPLTYMVAGFDGTQVVTKLITQAPPSPTPIVLSDPTWLGGTQFRFTLASAPGAVLEIWSSTNLSDWSSAGFVTNTTGTTTFTDSAATAPRSFYRAQQQ